MCAHILDVPILLRHSFYYKNQYNYMYYYYYYTTRTIVMSSYMRQTAALEARTITLYRNRKHKREIPTPPPPPAPTRDAILIAALNPLSNCAKILYTYIMCITLSYSILMVNRRRAGKSGKRAGNHPVMLNDFVYTSSGASYTYLYYYILTRSYPLRIYDFSEKQTLLKAANIMAFYVTSTYGSK